MRRQWKTLRAVVTMRTRLPIRAKDFSRRVHERVLDLYIEEKERGGVSCVTTADYNRIKKYL